MSELVFAVLIVLTPLLLMAAQRALARRLGQAPQAPEPGPVSVVVPRVTARPAPPPRIVAPVPGPVRGPAPPGAPPRRGRARLRAAVVMAEILGPPRAVRASAEREDLV